MDIFSLVARLTLDKSDYDNGLGQAEESAKGFGAKLKKGFGVAAAAATAVAGAASAAAAVVTKEVGALASYGDNIDKASQKLGISAEAYQEWDAVLQHSGTSIDSMGIGMKTLATQAAKGSEAFTALGISQEKAASMSREDLFSETITALQNVTDENKRAQLAQELFGRSAMELGPLLNTSAADTQAMKDRVHELGGVLSNEAVKAAAAYQDSLQDMQTAFSGLKRGMLAEFLPAITTVMDGLTDLMSGGDGIDKISEGINGFVGKLSEAIPRIMQTGSKIVLALADAIIDNLPKLIGAAVDGIMTIAKGLIDNLDKLVDAGLQIVLQLAIAIADALPELIPSIVDAIITIVDTLTDPEYLSMLVEAALKIIVALAEGLIKAAPRLIEKIPQIIINLVSAIIQSLPKVVQAGVELVGAWAKGIVQAAGSVISAIGNIGQSIIDGIGNLISGAVNWGKDLIDNFTAGIRAFINKPIDAVKGLAGRIKSFLGFSEPEEGPLSNFHTYAPDMMALFAQGIEDNAGLITDAIGKSFNFAPQIGSAQAPVTGGQTFTVPRQQAPQQAVMEIDRTVFGRLIYRLYNEEAARVGVNFTGGAY